MLETVLHGIYNFIIKGMGIVAPGQARRLPYAEPRIRGGPRSPHFPSRKYAIAPLAERLPVYDLGATDHWSLLAD